MHPIIARFGPITIYSYGMMVAIAFIMGIYLARLEASRKNITPDLIYDLAFFLVIGSLAGARIYYLVFFDPSSFIKDPVSIFRIWEGGLAIHGAILGGITASALFAVARRLSFWDLSDIIAPSIILGQAIGRFGCFLNGCCFGIPTKSALGIVFPAGSLADVAYHGLAVHPAQLYEMALDLSGFFILWSIRKKIKFSGGLFLIYLMTYSVIRLIISGLRGDSLYIWGSGIKIAQAISAVIFVMAMVIFIKRRKNV
jgi:phosphatidylglycerol---prolipoprotein diacylglyceryl transferase